MPRQRRTLGPRVKVDLASLRDLSPEERLNLLVRTLVECGGTSEADDSQSFRRRLEHAQDSSRKSDRP